MVLINRRVVLMNRKRVLLDFFAQERPAQVAVTQLNGDHSAG
jgi:hypothetical protein